MNPANVLRVLAWLARDTFRQSVESRVCWFMLALSVVAITICLSVSVQGGAGLQRDGERPDFLPRDDPDAATSQALLKREGVDVPSGDLTIAFGAFRVPLGRDARDAVQFLQFILAGGLASTAGLFLSLVWTAGFLPAFLAPRSITLLLARPVPIPRLGAIPWMTKDHRTYDITAMGWEVQPDGLYEALSMVHAYDPSVPLVVTENGAAFPDRLVDGHVHDIRRTAFYQDHLAEVLRAINDGIAIDGYFCWSLMDNFEWAEGFVPRFGLVYVDYDTQERTIKDSGYWFKRFLAG